MSLPENGASGPASGVRLVPLAHQWIVGICSIVFDIDVGQRVEHSVPAGCLSPEEKQDVAFHSFPVSVVVCEREADLASSATFILFSTCTPSLAPHRIPCPWSCMHGRPSKTGIATRKGRLPPVGTWRVPA